MNPFRSVGGRLALALVVVVAGALGIVYLIVVPSYRHSLVNSRVSDLRQTLRGVLAEPRGEAGVFPSAAWVQDTAVPVATGARVVVFSAPAPARAGRRLERRHLARHRERSDRSSVPRRGGGIVGGTVTRNGASFAEAAGAVTRDGPVVLLSSLAAQRPPVGRGRPEADARRRRHRGGIRDRVRLRARDALRPSHPPARDGRRADRRRTLRRDGGRSRPRRAGSARPHLRAHAAAACDPRPRPRRVHRERVARAADAAVLAGRVPRAARRRGARRGDPGRVPRRDARPAEPPDEARHRPARSVADGRGAARSRRRQPRPGRRRRVARGRVRPASRRGRP